jgi:16S rRNA (cytidine1402-2'-O)-methyltransferase
MDNKKDMLYIVATPIGNLKDISARAIEVLEKVSLICCEDTRRTGLLLHNKGIKNKLTTYNDHNKEKASKKIIEQLKNGEDVALVSDNGTPGISDPGFNLVRECIKEGISISPIPGPSAIISALSCSGLPTDRFTFYGFLPKSKKKAKDIFEDCTKKKETGIFYESPHRIKKTVMLLAEILPNISIVIARELTKKFEEFIRGTPKQVFQEIKDKNIRGEIVLLLNAHFVEFGLLNTLPPSK